MTDLVGLVVAAGAGRRSGGPKALRRTASGEPWTARAVALLRSAGCERVVVVLGAQADAARALVPATADVVAATDWQDGMGASLRAGFAALPTADAVLVTLVDLPGMPLAVPLRVLAAGTGRDVLARAWYGRDPGHPVLVGHDHWTAFAESLHGDQGGRRYLVTHAATPVECADLFDGEDVDGP